MAYYMECQRSWYSDYSEFKIQWHVLLRDRNHRAILQQCPPISSLVTCREENTVQNTAPDLQVSTLKGAYIPLQSAYLSQKSAYKLRSSANGPFLEQPTSRLHTAGDRSFSVAAPQLWNETFETFKRLLKSHVFRKAYAKSQPFVNYLCKAPLSIIWNWRSINHWNGAL